MHPSRTGSRLAFREAARVLDIFVPATRPHNHRTVSNRLGKAADQIEKWDVSRDPIESVAPASLPFPFSLMAPIFARFPAIKAGISRSRWDALLRKAEHRVSLPVRRISLPANTISFTRRCARKDGCLAETSLSLATERSGCRASSSVQHVSPSRIFSTGFIYRYGCGTSNRPGRASAKSGCLSAKRRSACAQASASPLERICPRGKRSRKADARPIGSASRFSRRPRQNQAPIRADKQSRHLPGAERSFDRQLLSAILVRSADIQFAGRKCRQQPRQCPYE